MGAYYYVRGPQAAVHNAEQFSGKTARADLSVTDWAATEDSDQPQRYKCPRAFIPIADGTIVLTALEDSSSGPTYVLAGITYSIAIRAITRTGTSAALQVANAVTLLY